MAPKGKPKLKTSLPKVPQRIPKPQVSDIYKKPLGGTFQENPPVTPRNSQRAVKQQTQLDIPGVKLR